MKKRTITKATSDEIEAMPRISLIIPYEGKMKNEKFFHNLLISKAAEIEEELLNDFTEEIATDLITKLRNTIKTVHQTHGKSIGIFVSPVAEKVYYFSPSRLEDYQAPVLVQSPN